MITNPTGQSLRIQKFVEVTDPTTGDLVYSALDASDSLAISVRQPPGLSSLAQASSMHTYPGQPAAGANRNELYSAQLLSLVPQQPSSLQVPSAYRAPPMGMMSQKGCSYDGFPVTTPHPLAGPLDEKRAMAANLSTIYIYDFLVSDFELTIGS